MRVEVWQWQGMKRKKSKLQYIPGTLDGNLDMLSKGFGIHCNHADLPLPFHSNLVLPCSSARHNLLCM